MKIPRMAMPGRSFNAEPAGDGARADRRRHPRSIQRSAANAFKPSPVGSALIRDKTKVSLTVLDHDV